MTTSEQFPFVPIRPGFRRVQTLARTFLKILFGLRIEGRENFPRTGPFILASNHKSWFDPPIVGSTSPREIHFAAKKELFIVPIVGPLIKYLNSVPVRRKGFDREALVRLGEALEKGGGIIIFPEGTRFQDSKLHAPKAGVGMMALKYDVPIVPAFISGSAFVRYQIFRRKLKITFGKSFRISDLGPLPEGKEAYQFIADAVMAHIAATGGIEPPEKKLNPGMESGQ